MAATPPPSKLPKTIAALMLISALVIVLGMKRGTNLSTLTLINALVVVLGMKRGTNLGALTLISALVVVVVVIGMDWGDSCQPHTHLLCLDTKLRYGLDADKRPIWYEVWNSRLHQTRRVLPVVVLCVSGMKWGDSNRKQSWWSAKSHVLSKRLGFEALLHRAVSAEALANGRINTAQVIQLTRGISLIRVSG